MGSISRTYSESAPAPTAPVVTVSALSTTSVRVDWTAATGGALGLKSYSLYFGTSAGSLSLVDTFSRATTRWDIGSLTTGTTYYARVDAVDGYGQTTASSVASGAPQTTGGGSGGTTPSSQPPLQRTMVTHLGDFSVPAPSYSGTAMWYDEAMGCLAFYRDGQGRKTLFMRTTTTGALDVPFGQLQIPSTLSTSTSWAALTPGTWLQEPSSSTKIMDGASAPSWFSSGAGTGFQAGFVYNNRYIVTVAHEYGGVAATEVIAASGLTLSAAGDYTGLKAMSASHRNGGGDQRRWAGGMCAVPTEWQSAIGGPVLGSAYIASTIGGSSFGPSCTAFNPDDIIAGGGAISGTTLLGYANGDLCELSPPNQADGSIFNLTSATQGIFWVPGTRTVAFLTGTGTGLWYYGPNTSTWDLEGTVDPAGGQTLNYDPQMLSNGPHAANQATNLGYIWMVLCYDANDLAEVKAGTKQMHKVYPTHRFQLPMLDIGGLRANSAGMCAFDPVEMRLYVPYYASNAPRIAVFQINITAATDPVRIDRYAIGRMQVGRPYSDQIVAVGAGVTYAVTAGSLPAGVSLSSSGALSGTPTTQGIYDFTVTATNAGGSDTRRYRGYVHSSTGFPYITSRTLSPMSVGSPFSQTFTCDGATGAPVTWESTTGGSIIPPGLTFSSGGVLSGTPTTSGRYIITIVARNSIGRDSVTFVVTL